MISCNNSSKKSLQLGHSFIGKRLGSLPNINP